MTRTKARLVARGFQEQNSEVFKGSPTCGKENLQLVLPIISTKGWDCNSIDTKSAFLQGKEIGWNVYLIQPIEAESENVVWRLNTCIYGLGDASRNWYLSVKNELTKIGVKTRK